MYHMEVSLSATHRTVCIIFAGGGISLLGRSGTGVFAPSSLVPVKGNSVEG